MAGRYASTTSVPVSKSKVEIETILERYGASQFLSGWDADNTVIGFTMPVADQQFRQVRFVLPMPSRNEKRFTHSSRGLRTDDASMREWEQACRQRWRALALVIKAKLEAVDCGISVFEDEFLANIVMGDGRTVSAWVQPRIALAYQGGDVANLLPDYSTPTTAKGEGE